MGLGEYFEDMFEDTVLESYYKLLVSFSRSCCSMVDMTIQVLIGIPTLLVLLMSTAIMGCCAPRVYKKLRCWIRKKNKNDEKRNPKRKGKQRADFETDVLKKLEEIESKFGQSEPQENQEQSEVCKLRTSLLMINEKLNEIDENEIQKNDTNHVRRQEKSAPSPSSRRRKTHETKRRPRSHANGTEKKISPSVKLVDLKIIFLGDHDNGIGFGTRLKQILEKFRIRGLFHKRKNLDLTAPQPLEKNEYPDVILYFYNSHQQKNVDSLARDFEKFSKLTTSNSAVLVQLIRSEDTRPKIDDKLRGEMGGVKSGIFLDNKREFKGRRDNFVFAVMDKKVDFGKNGTEIRKIYVRNMKGLVNLLCGIGDRKRKLI